MLEIRGLTVRYEGRLTAVRDLDLDVFPGEFIALAGESGSGKSTVAKALLGLLPSTAMVTGSARLGEVELLGRAENRWKGIRGPRLAVVPQGAMTGLNPVRRVGAQLAELLHLHAGVTGRVAAARSRELLRLVRLDPALLRAYPHQLSGGMRQRVAIALALAGEPELLIADEPTTGLDAVIGRHILELLDELRSRMLAVLVVSHDLPGLLRHADRVAVMYAGRIVELRGASGIVSGARHPYTRGLVAASAAVDPDVPWRAIPGSPPALGLLPRGCTFADRCPLAEPQCRVDEPELLPDGDGAVACHLAAKSRDTSFPAVPPSLTRSTLVESVAQLRGVGRIFHDRRRTVVALGQIDLDIEAGAVVGLVGESGSGKTTIARLLLGLLRPTAGTVRVNGQDMGRLRGRALRNARRRIGYVHQDSYGALHPAMRVTALVSEPLRLAGMRGAAARERVHAALASAGLPTDPHFLGRFPHELSGGQRQRVALARALVNRPALLVADEATSMLDVSTRAGIAATLRTLADEHDLAVLFVTHDLGEAVQLCDRIIVVKDGEAVETGTPQHLVSSPAHPYTAELLGAATAPAS